MTKEEKKTLIMLVEDEIDRLKYSKQTHLKIFEDMGIQAGQLDDVQFRERIAQLKAIKTKIRKLHSEQTRL